MRNRRLHLAQLSSATVVAGVCVNAALGAAPASADVVLWAADEVRVTHIDGEETLLRPRVGDFDLDGTRDLLISDANCLSFPCGPGSAYSIVHPMVVDDQGRLMTRNGVLEGSSSDVRDAAVADVVDHDGRPDLIATSPGTGWVNAPLGDSFGGPAFAGLPGASLALGDFDHDGRADEASATCTGSTGDVLAALGNATGAFPYFGPAATYQAGTCARDVAAGDLDGDLRSDLVVGSSGADHGVFVLLAKADGSFDDAVKIDALTDPRSVAIADVDGDDIPDIVSVDRAADTAAIYVGDGTGDFDDSVEFESGPGAVSVAAADLDGDGADDLVAGYEGDPVADVPNAVGVLLGAGDPDTAGGGLFDSGGEGTRRVAAADLSGDGFADLAVTHDGSATVSLFTNAPAPSFQPEEIVFPAQTIGTSGAATTITVSNDGTPPLHIVDANTYGDSDAGTDYRLTSDTCTGQMLAAGQSCALAVRFTPTRAGTIDGAVEIVSDAPWMLDYLDMQGVGRTPARPPAGSGPGTGASAPQSVTPLRLKAKPRGVRRVLATRKLVVLATCEMRCTLTASGRILIAHNRTIPLKRVVRVAEASVRTKLKLKLNGSTMRAIRAALRRHRKVSAHLTVKAAAPGRPPRVKTFEVRLRSPDRGASQQQRARGFSSRASCRRRSKSRRDITGWSGWSRRMCST